MLEIYNWKGYPDRPMHQDPRLTALEPLVRHYRNLWLEADFDERYEEAKHFEALYRLYRERLASGSHYEPLF